MGDLLNRVRMLEADLVSCQSNTAPLLNHLNGTATGYPYAIVRREGHVLASRLSLALRSELLLALDDLLEQARKDALAEAKAVIAELEPADG